MWKGTLAHKSSMRPWVMKWVLASIALTERSVESGEMTEQQAMMMERVKMRVTR